VVVFWNIPTDSDATIRFLVQNKLSPDHDLNPGIREYVEKFGRDIRSILNVLNAELCTCDTHI
jgi:hypothetical protein